MLVKKYLCSLKNIYASWKISMVRRIFLFLGVLRTGCGNSTSVVNTGQQSTWAKMWKKKLKSSKLWRVWIWASLVVQYSRLVHKIRTNADLNMAWWSGFVGCQMFEQKVRFWTPFWAWVVCFKLSVLRVVKHTVFDGWLPSPILFLSVRSVVYPGSDWIDRIVHWH